ncbi:MAG: hypothetical protein ACM3KR_01065 [Deltaproteobacteria bacterium]
MKCVDCKHFEETPTDIIPILGGEHDEKYGWIQNVSVIEHEHEGKCTHEYNWRPSRGDMPCDKDYSCIKFESNG